MQLLYMNRSINSMGTNANSNMFKGSIILTILLFVALFLYIYNKIIHYTDIPFLEPPTIKTFGEHYQTIVNDVVPEKNKHFFI